jgi:hypothetical protein
LDKGAKNTCWRNTATSTNGVLDIHMQKNETRYLSTYKNTNSKWTKDINVRPETLKLQQINTGKTPEDVGVGNDLLNRTPIAQK